MFQQTLIHEGQVWNIAPLGEYLDLKDAEDAAKNIRIGGYFTHIVKGFDSVGRPAWAVYRRWSHMYCPRECSYENLLGRYRV